MVGLKIFSYLGNVGLFLSEVQKQLAFLGVPKNLSKMYNFGFMLGVCLGTQIVSGLVLSMVYMSGSDSGFANLFTMMGYSGVGSFVRYIHINVVSFFFIFIYMHIGRGLYYSSFLNKNVWMSGVTILLLLMAIAFIGYVLPNNQMSYWGASVITSLLSEVPYLGKELVELIWGSVSVCKLTLLRFFSLHFILPFVLLVFVILHIILLHEKGSSNPGGVKPTKDSFGSVQMKTDFSFLSVIAIFVLLILSDEDFFGDDENFVKCNVVETPVHIQPEWYFLFAYAILRSITNKLGGVIGLVSSIAILYLLALKCFSNYNSFVYKPYFKVLYWTFVFNFIFLSWMGMCSVEYPFVHMTQFFSVVYFSYYLVYLL